MSRAWLGAVLAGPALLAPPPAGGQSPPEPELHAIEAAVDEGRLDGTRAALEAWFSAADTPAPEDVGRARYLRARLMADVDSARAEYLAVALDGRSSYGSRAWLRLAQLDLARGDAERAIADLDRLRADYPSSPAAASSWYWTARALEQGGDLGSACRAFERGARAAGDAAAADVAALAAAASRRCLATGLRFSLQVGAFSREDAAGEILDTLESSGYPARVFEEGGLHKVRVGWFSSPEAARALARRLREGGYSVTVVAGES